MRFQNQTRPDLEKVVIFSGERSALSDKEVRAAHFESIAAKRLMQLVIPLRRWAR
jgi:hypothetical protein